MKRKTLTLILTLALCLTLLPGIAIADSLTASGSVVGAQEIAIKAPVTGDLMPFSLREGDLAESGSLLFEIEAEKLYANYDGVVGGVTVKPGDATEAVTAIYKALFYIQPDSAFVIKSSTSDAYDEPENKFLQVGTHVYLKSRSSSKYTGEGWITEVDGASFTVEVLDGNLRYDEPVTIHLNADHSNDSRIGRGDVTRVNPIAVNASGTVLKVHVTEGQHVKKGDLLIEYVTDTLTPSEAQNANILRVTAYQELILSSISATQGSRATKGSVLAKAFPRDSMQVAVNVDESYISKLQVGGSADIEFENVKSGQVKGTIASISYINASDSSDSQYTVYVDFTPDADIRIGMRATVSFEF